MSTQVNAFVKMTADYIVNNFKTGQLLQHSWLARQLGVKYTSRKYKTLVAQLKEFLCKEYGVFIEAVPGKGYKIVPPERAVDMQVKLATHGHRCIVRAAERARHIPVTEIADVEKRVAMVTQIQHLQVAASLSALGPCSIWAGQTSPEEASPLTKALLSSVQSSARALIQAIQSTKVQ